MRVNRQKASEIVMNFAVQKRAVHLDEFISKASNKLKSRSLEENAASKEQSEEFTISALSSD